MVKSIADTATSNGVHDIFRYGPRSLKAEVAPHHSLENRLTKVHSLSLENPALYYCRLVLTLSPPPPTSLYSQWDETQDATRLTMYRQIYGIHAPVKLLMERQLVSRATSGRIPDLPSSNLSLDILMGRDETIDFEDFLTGS